MRSLQKGDRAALIQDVFHRIDVADIVKRLGEEDILVKRTLALAALLTASILAAPPAAADIRLVVPGTGPVAEPLAQILGFSRNDWNEFNPQIGANWFPSITTQVVDYPASLWPGSGLNTPTARAIHRNRPTSTPPSRRPPRPANTSTSPD